MRDPVEALRAELAAHPRARAAVEASPGLLYGLAGLVGLYAPGGQWYEFRTRRGISTAVAARKARSLIRLVDELDELLQDRAVAAFLTHGGTWLADPSLAWAPRLLAALRRQASAVAKLSTRARGRPRDRWRDRFCLGVARIVEGTGHEVMKSRQGLLAEILSCAFAAAGDQQPEDLFPLTAQAVDALRSSPPTRVGSSNIPSAAAGAVRVPLRTPPRSPRAARSRRSSTVARAGS